MTLMAEQETRTDLSDLVRNRRAELGLSLRALAAKTVDPQDPDGNPQWKYGRLRSLERAEPNLDVPTESELRGLAAGLDLAPSVVMEAHSAQFVGVRTHWDPTGEIGALTHDIMQLNDSNRAIIADLARSLRKRQDDAGGSGKPDGS
jgi:transcriptional regulator with XRE-family HTH domain